MTKSFLKTITIIVEYSNPTTQVIIILSSINLLMPTTALYMLSMSDYGRHLQRVIPIKVFYQMVHLLVINIPFLGVRIYLWWVIELPSAWGCCN